ncbi:hypothetical protein EUA93_13320 [Nocardioides oleivorans]|uniref:Uncharacterized protein n=1 Tax=Nocardioides oleivorans TaxID=273676 RepID=A0A4Q2S0T1_9ACTN|nr:hypothetical protein [Nocardioides oleivorans]RYB95230.1 hypothetical protein EUA93_13320 [Nocardioides oleivorans]
MGAVMVATGLVAVVPTGPAGAVEWWESSPTATWYDGQVSYSSVLNCFSVIQGSPLYENGVGAYIGYLADPDNAGGPKPVVNDKTWIRYRVYGMGNPCTGGSYFRPKFYLPQGWSWDRTRQIACAYDGSGGSAPQANCPGWDHLQENADHTVGDPYWNNGSGQGGGLWGVAQGHYWEFQLPVRVGPNAQSGVVLDAHLDVADGNSNPQMLLRTNNVYVFNGTPGANNVGVMYDQPSSYDQATLPFSPGGPTRYGMLSAFQAVIAGRAGSARFEISTNPNMTPVLGSESFSFAASQFPGSVKAMTDWADAGVTLQPGVTYYWRGSILPTSGAPAVGEVQSFRLKSGGGVDATSLGATTSGGGVGTGSGGVGGGVITPIPQPTPPTPPVPNPPAAPTATSTVPKSAQARKGVVVSLTCTAACSAKASATVSKKLGKRLGTTTLGSARGSLGAAGSTKLTIRLSKKLRAKLERVGSVRATVKITTTVGGTSSTTTAKVTVKG